MTRTIDGFMIEPWASDTYMFRRTAVPYHGYEYRITRQGVQLVARVPVDVSDGDADEDAKRYQHEAAATAKKYREHLFPNCGSGEAAE